MNRRKLQHQQKVEQTRHIEQHRETEALTTAEEVLRADARQTAVPPAIARLLTKASPTSASNKPIV